MFKITCKQFDTIATTSSLFVCDGMAFALLEAISLDGGQFTISNGHEEITAVYIGEYFNIDGDVYRAIYEASNSITYRLQQMEG